MFGGRRPRARPKVVIASNGNRGAIEPYVLLGLRLKTLHDCEVTLFTNPDHESLVVYMGLSFESNGIQAMSAYAGREMEKVIANSRSQIGRILHVAHLNQINTKCLRSCAEGLVVLLRTLKADVCVMGQDHFWDALWIPKALGVPCLILANTNGFHGFYPIFQTNDTVSAQNCEWRWSSHMLDYLLLDSYVKHARSCIGEPMLRALGADQLFPRNGNDLLQLFSGSYSDFLPFGIMADRVLYSGKHTFLLGPPPAAPASIRGGPFYGGNTHELNRLDTFLHKAQGGPLVYIGWGSTPWAHPLRMTQFALETLLLSGCRGVVLLTGFPAFSIDSIPDADLKDFCKDHVFFASSLPHAALFPRCNVIVHHGGHGTAYAAFRAGVPSVITPLLYKHVHFANAVNRLGIGVGTDHILSLTPQVLCDAITTCLGFCGAESSNTILYKCKRLAAELCDYNSKQHRGRQQKKNLKIASTLPNTLGKKPGLQDDAMLLLVLDTIRAADEKIGGTYWPNYNAWVESEQAERSAAEKRSCFFMCSESS